MARNAREEAERNLSWTKVYAETDGTASNLQLSSGFYLMPGTTAISLQLSTGEMATFGFSLNHALRRGFSLALYTLKGVALPDGAVKVSAFRRGAHELRPGLLRHILVVINRTVAKGDFQHPAIYVIANGIKAG